MLVGDIAHIVHVVPAIPTGIFLRKSAADYDETALETTMKADMEQRFAEKLALCEGVGLRLIASLCAPCPRLSRRRPCEHTYIHGLIVNVVGGGLPFLP
jgi:hypothetical protein